jgi:hypothetical protein
MEPAVEKPCLLLLRIETPYAYSERSANLCVATSKRAASQLCVGQYMLVDVKLRRLGRRRRERGAYDVL